MPKEKTNRGWLTQKLINMSDDEFADIVCGSELWSCDDCRKNKINNYGYCQGCKEEFCKWLQQGYDEDGKIQKS